MSNESKPFRAPWISWVIAFWWVLFPLANTVRWLRELGDNPDAQWIPEELLITGTFAGLSFLLFLQLMWNLWKAKKQRRSVPK